MATKDILLLEPVEFLGDEGEQVSVKAGYARNFLFPQKLAVPVTRANRRQIEALQARRVERLARELADAQAVADKLNGAHLAIPVKTGPGGKLFGAVTNADLQSRLAEEGINLERKRIHLAEPVKALGKHTFKAKIHPDVDVEIEFEVVSENPIEEGEGEGEEGAPDPEE